MEDDTIAVWPRSDPADQPAAGRLVDATDTAGGIVSPKRYGRRGPRRAERVAHAAPSPHTTSASSPLQHVQTTVCRDSQLLIWFTSVSDPVGNAVQTQTLVPFLCRPDLSKAVVAPARDEMEMQMKDGLFCRGTR